MSDRTKPETQAHPQPAPKLEPRSVGPKIRQHELAERVQAYDPNANEELLHSAYIYAMKKHSKQTRASGDPYFTHPLEVASILTELELDDATIATALLHDVIEDTDATRAEIDQLFGPKIGALVDGLTKIKKLDLVSRKTQQAESFRKLLIAISSDIRVLLVKLADRLHNMRTLEHMKPASRERISEETLEIYAPLAGRMGMQSWREELEALAFRWGYPEPYAIVTERLAALERHNEGLVEEIIKALNVKLEEGGIQAEVSGRQKLPYSIWRKVENRHITLEQLADIYAFRVIVDSVDDCYRVLGLAHSAWQMVPGRFKDYISLPKPNGYRSLHTTILRPPNQRVELQIRTREMHRIAEYGVAAHALYKDNASVGPDKSGHAPVSAQAARDGGPYMWLRRTVENLLDGNNAVDFLENTKLELFQDEVFCFTPKGSLIALPRGATAIDFAYAVHSDVGNKMKSALINKRPMPLATQLKNGDEVSIETSPKAEPAPEWAKLAITGRARSSIRRALRERERQGFTELGRQLLMQRLQAHNLTYSDERVRKALARLKHRSQEFRSIEYRTVEDALVAIGRREIEIVDALREIAPEIAAELINAPDLRKRAVPDHSVGEDDWFILAGARGLKFREYPQASLLADPGQAADRAKLARVAIAVGGRANDLPVRFEEGGAVPGDRIVGVRAEDGGIMVFHVHSPRLATYDHGDWQWVDVAWDVDAANPQRFKARIVVTCTNEPGTLGAIALFIGDTDGNIDNLRMLERAADFTQMLIAVEVYNLKHLTKIITGLRSNPSVSKVERVFD